MKTQAKNIFILLSFALNCFSLQAQGTKIPDSVVLENSSIQDRFAAALQEECPDGNCYSSGCVVSNFLTLDSNQDSSLPGLESDVKGDTKKLVQYKLSSSRCEFSHEPIISNSQVNLIKQRLAARVKTAGINIQIISSKLNEKVEDMAAPSLENTTPIEIQTWERLLMGEVFPFVPWILLLLTICICTLALIWGLRALGRKKEIIRDTSLRTRASDHDNMTQKGMLPLAEPSSQMILLRMTQLRQLLDEDEKLVEYTLRPHFEQKDFNELCLFLRHFGPSYLSIFKKRAELTEVLAELSEKYSVFENPETPAEHWQFLERIERKMISAQVKINNQPLSDEFAFLGSISVDELIGLLKGESDLEAVAAIAYAPASLKEEFFAIAPPVLTVKIVEQLTKIDRLPDSFVRETAKKLRKRYNDHAKEYKTVRVNKTPLIEIALNHLTETERKKLVEDLRQEDPNALLKLAPAIFLDESLLHLDSETITEAFLEVSPKDAAAYLGKYPWGSEVINKMNPRLKDAVEKYTLAQHKDETGAIHARNKLTKYVRNKTATGQIDINLINRKILGAI